MLGQIRINPNFAYVHDSLVSVGFYGSGLRIYVAPSVDLPFLHLLTVVLHCNMLDSVKSGCFVLKILYFAVDERTLSPYETPTSERQAVEISHFKTLTGKQKRSKFKVMPPETWPVSLGLWFWRYGGSGLDHCSACFRLNQSNRF